MVINPYIFKREPNTFIGGIAKLGGTGANAPILTAAELAATLGISESIIKGFKVVGEDVECRITSDFSLPIDCFQINENIIFFNSHSVTLIERRAFNSCGNLTSVEFPLVTSVGNNAFQYCTGLTSVELPLVTSVGGSAFDSCSNLTSVEFPLVTSISGYAFYSCGNLTSVEFPLVTSVGNNAFQYCTGLTSVELPLVTSVGGSAFDSCSSLVEINIPLAKTLGFTSKNNNVFSNIALNAEINANIFLKTADAGELEGDLLYAYTSRNATINFYDDNGDFVETYNPNPELYTENDACSIGSNETESIGAGWSVDGDISMSVEESTQSDWCIKFMSTSTDFNRAILAISGLEIGETYEISLDGRAEDATGLSAGQGFIRTDVNNGWDSLAYADIDSFNWQRKSFNAVATDTDAILEYFPSYTASGVEDGWSGFLDNISIKKIS